MNHFAPWHTHQYCVIDFETTGVDPETCAPVSVAAVRFDRGEVVDSYTTLINPGRPIPAETTKIHGITDAMVQAASVPDAWGALGCDDFRRVSEGAMPVAFNAPYDSRIAARYSVEMPVGPWIDPLVVSRKVDRYAKGGHRLATVCERWGVKLTDAHDALADATATGLLLWAMRAKLGDSTYSELIRRQRIHAAAHNARHHEWDRYCKAQDWAHAEQGRREGAEV